MQVLKQCNSCTQAVCVPKTPELPICSVCNTSNSVFTCSRSMCQQNATKRYCYLCKPRELEEPIPHCYCNKAARKGTVVKDGKNKGRKFFGCASWPSAGCTYFAWSG